MRNRLKTGVLLGVLFALGSVAPASAVVTNQNAGDAIGQINSANAAVYTKSGINSGPNNRGFNTSQGVVIDTVSHRMFISDTGNHRVLVFNLDSSDSPLDAFADNVLGQPNLDSQGAAVSQSRMNSPRGLAYDPSTRRLYVADAGNNRVLVFDVTAVTDGENAVNVLGQALFTTNTAATTQAGLRTPVRVALATDTAKLFIADNANHRVIVHNITTITNGQNAANVLGQAVFTTSATTTTAVGMNSPSGLAYDPAGQRLFVSEINNNRVIIHSVGAIANGQAASNVLGQALFTTSAAATTQAGLRNPQGVAYATATARLYISDSGNNRVILQNVAVVANGQNALNVLGQANFTSNGAATTQSRLRTPTEAHFDPVAVRLWIADSANHRVVRQNVAAVANGQNAADEIGQLTNLDAVSYTMLGANNGPGIRGFSGPFNVEIDTVNHRAYVADTGHSRVLVFNLDASDQLLDRLADFVIGQANFNSTGGAATQSRLNAPRGLLYDPSGNRLFVADTSNNRVVVFNMAALANGMNAANVLGQALFTTNTAATTQAGLRAPSQLAFDPVNSRLFIADNTNHRVIVQNVATITNGQNAANVLGQALFTTNAAATTQAGLRNPQGVVYSTVTGRLFIADTNNHRVVVHSASSITDGQGAINVLGQANFTSGAAATSQIRMRSPADVLLSPDGAILYVADTANHRVTTYEVDAVTNGEAATQVLGKANFTTGGALTTQPGFSSPQGMTFDPRNSRLWISESGNSRVVIHDASPPVVPSTGSVISVTTVTAFSGWTATARTSRYDVLLSTLSANPPTVFSSSRAVTTATATLTALLPNTTYFGFVRSCNGSGCSAYLAMASTPTLATAPVSAVSTYTAVTFSSISLTWGANGNPSSTTYLVQMSTASNFTGTLFSSTTILTTGTVGGLSASTTYFARVQALNHAGIATAFRLLGSTRTALGVPAAPASGVFLAVDRTSATATWASSVGASSYTFVVSISSVNPPTVVAASSSTLATTGTVTGLLLNTTYFGFVSACGPAGCSSYTAIASTPTLATAPVSMAVGSAGATSISVSWSANGNPAGTRYDIEISTNNTLFVTAGTTTAVSFTATGLASGQLYYLRARARNHAGIATSTSNTVSAVATGSLPVAPVNLQASQGVVLNSPVVTYSWNAVTAYADGTPIPSGNTVQYVLLTANDPNTPLASWTVVTTQTALSSGTFTGAGALAYYAVRTLLNGSLSDRSVVIDNRNPARYVYPAASGTGFAALTPQNPFLGVSTPSYSLTLAPGGTGGAVAAAGTLSVIDAQSGQPVSPYVLPSAAEITLPASGAGGISGAGVEFFNGTAWVLVGNASNGSLSGSVLFSVTRPGAYRLSRSQGGGGPVVTAVYPRVFSPDGDGVNDVVVFKLNNPNGDSVSGEIFDMDSAKVADMTPGPSSGLSLKWDGRDSGGRRVRGGPFLYQITVGGRRYNGSILVVY